MRPLRVRSGLIHFTNSIELAQALLGVVEEMSGSPKHDNTLRYPTMSGRKSNPNDSVLAPSKKPKRRVGRPVKDPSRGPQRPIRIPLGYPKDSPEGQAELTRRIKEGQRRAQLRKSQATESKGGGMQIAVAQGGRT